MLACISEIPGINPSATRPWARLSIFGDLAQLLPTTRKYSNVHPMCNWALEVYMTPFQYEVCRPWSRRAKCPESSAGRILGSKAWVPTTILGWQGLEDGSHLAYICLHQFSRTSKAFRLRCRETQISVLHTRKMFACLIVCCQVPSDNPFWLKVCCGRNTYLFRELPFH